MTLWAAIFVGFVGKVLSITVVHWRGALAVREADGQLLAVCGLGWHGYGVGRLTDKRLSPLAGCFSVRVLLCEGADR